MKLRGFKVNKKRLFSLLVASGITLCNMGNAEIYSYNSDVNLKDGGKAKLYFSKKIGDVNYAYISSNSMVGFIYEDEVIMNNTYQNNYFIEDNSSISVIKDNAYIYQTPNVDNSKIVGVVNKNTIVDIIAKTSDGWYVIYTNGISGFMRESSFIEKNKEEKITVAKITGNNVNIRYSGNTQKDNIIGFADVSDTFKILGKENDWYIIDYLGQTAYVSEKYVKEIEINKSDLEIKRMSYLTEDTYFYTDLDNKDGLVLPAYQNIFILDETIDSYKVKVDGVIGFVSKKSVKKLSKTCIVVDLSRQIVKVFKNSNEIFRAHIISGRESMQTQIGCFKIGHKVEGYQLTPDNYVEYWIEYDGNRGLHDASWQKEEYFTDVAHNSYQNYANGHGKTYPYKHGSHGCDNMTLSDIMDLYRLVNVGDNVLIIGPNNLIKNHLISKFDNNKLNIFNDDKIKIKRLV